MLLVITGPASSGKDTIMRALVKKYPGMKRVISTTTRQKRLGEEEGKDYHFVTREAFQKMIDDGQFLEYVDFFGNLYGTTKDELNPLYGGEDLIWRVETSRAAAVDEVLPKDLQRRALVLYIDVPDWNVLRQRMRQRGMPDEKIEERLAKDKADFAKYGSSFKNIIYNEEGKLEQTMKKTFDRIDSRL